METQNTDQFAGFGRRILAYVVDFLILFFIGNTIQTLLGVNVLREVMKVTTLEQMQQVTSNYSYLNLISLFLGVFYFVFFWSKNNGQTPGKLLLAIKIVKADGSDLSISNAIARYIGYFVSSFAFCLGFIWILFDKNKQGWHDKIAGTVVVQTKEKPKMVLAILLFICCILLVSSYMGLIFYKSYELAMVELQPGAVSKTANNYIEEMNPDAKIHRDKALEITNKLVAEGNASGNMVEMADTAIEEYLLALDIDPTNPRLWVELGATYTWPNTKGDANSIIDAYKKAVDLDPANYVNINYLGEMYYRIGKYDEAILESKKAIRITGDNYGYAHLNVARSYYQLKVYDSAKEHYMKALETFESNNENGKWDKEILQIQKELSSIPS